MKRRVTLKKESESETALIKKEIQCVLREIVIKRDGGCIFAPGRKDEPLYFRSVRELGLNPLQVPPCYGYAKDGHLILQADHLITRGNSATYADPRLVVCLCKGHHGWKSVGGNSRKAQYDAIVRQLLPADRVALWDRMESESWKPRKMDWKLELAALNQELKRL